MTVYYFLKIEKNIFFIHPSLQKICFSYRDNKKRSFFIVKIWRIVRILFWIYTSFSRL